MRHIGDLLDLDKVRSELARHQIATQYGDLGGGDIRLVTLGADGATPVVHIGPGYVPEGPVAGANADRLAVIGDLVVAPDDDGNPDDEAIERATIDARGIGDRSEEAIACTAAMMHRSADVTADAAPDGRRVRAHARPA